jgi:pyridoxine 5-phosphate synthase
MDRLAAALKIPLNFEMANTPEMVSKALKLLPTSVCLVPEKRQEITTEGGLDVQSQQASIARTVQELQDAGIEVSLFIDPAPEVVRASIDTGARAIELHTGAFAEGFREAVSRRREIQRLVEAAELGHQGKLKVNAGHGLNYLNVKGMHEVPWLEELNIGHSIVAHALFVGFDMAVREMLQLIHPVG